MRTVTPETITYRCDMCGCEQIEPKNRKYWARIAWEQHDDWARHWRSDVDLCSVCAEKVINLIEGRKK